MKGHKLKFLLTLSLIVTSASLVVSQSSDLKLKKGAERKVTKAKAKSDRIKQIDDATIAIKKAKREIADQKQSPLNTSGFRYTSTAIEDNHKVIVKNQHILDVLKATDQNDSLPPIFLKRFGGKYLSNAMTFDGGEGSLKSDFTTDLWKPGASVNIGDYLNKTNDTTYPKHVLRGYVKIGSGSSLTELFNNLTSTLSGEAVFTYTKVFQKCNKIKYYRGDIEYEGQVSQIRQIESEYNAGTITQEDMNTYYDSIARKLAFNTQMYHWFSVSANSKWGQEAAVDSQTLTKSNVFAYNIGVKFSYNFAHIINDGKGFDEFKWGGDKYFKVYLNLGLTNKSLTSINQYFTNSDSTTRDVKSYGTLKSNVGVRNLFIEPGFNAQVLGVSSKAGLQFNFCTRTGYDFNNPTYKQSSVVELSAGINFSISALAGSKANDGSKQNVFIGFDYLKGISGSEHDKSVKSITPIFKFETPLVFNKK